MELPHHICKFSQSNKAQDTSMNIFFLLSRYLGQDDPGVVIRHYVEVSVLVLIVRVGRVLMGLFLFLCLSRVLSIVCSKMNTQWQNACQKPKAKDMQIWWTHNWKNNSVLNKMEQAKE